MKKLLPLLVFCFVIVVTLWHVTPRVFAAPAVVPTPDIGFTPDSEVNFVGKADARSIQFLNWTLQNYNWACVTRNGQGACDNTNNPLIDFWATIRNIVYALFALFVLVTAFVLITTRGRSLTVQRFLPRFVAVILLVTFSYAILQLIYITGDVIQGFFLTKHDGTNALISAKDLLFVGWDYETFVGLRKVHPFFDESVFVNLLLARMTAVTYYAMTGILLIRKIILWFFIVVSPVFPVLLLYYPIRNTAKIWIGEFFRWLMYAPLFSIFLAGLVSLWKANVGASHQGIPLVFDFTTVGTSIVYPTATNILLGGPGQTVTISNNLNTPDTFAQYVVALIMLWVVILLPFVLLQIFLDYLNSFSLSESPAFQKIINSGYSLINRPVVPQPPGGGMPPPGPGDTGIARQLPWAKYGSAEKIPDIRQTGDARELPIVMPLPRAAAAQFSSDVLTATNLSLPTMRDIAVYERAMLSQGAPTSQTVQALQNLANPQSITNPIEREKFNQLRERLIQQSQSGNQVAGAVISAVNIVNNVSNVSNNKVSNLKNALSQITNPTSAPVVARDKMTKIHDSLVKESQQGSELASTILATTKESSTSQMQDLRERLVQESMNNNATATNVLATAMSSVETSTLSEVMKEATNATQSSQMHDMLVKESEKGNQLATEILSSKETASTTQLEQFKEKLIDASLAGNQAATTILSSAISKSEVKNSQQVLTQISNPATITNTVTREQISKLRDKLTEAQQKGDSLAGEILTTASDMTKTDMKDDTKQQEVQKIKEKLTEAKAKGNQLAGEVLATMATQAQGQAGLPADTNLPQSNRVQTVSLEDYEAVKKMWAENYKTMDVPEGLDNRKSWIDSEVKDIDNIIALLTSEDQSKVQEGMQQVSNILPFLMLGGFSQEEIVAYLKAKREAGKSVLETVVNEENEEDTMVSVETRRTKTATSTMAQSAEIDDSSVEASPIQQVITRPVTIRVNDELLKLTNLPVPTMRDVVKFETAFLSKDVTNRDQVTKMKETLSQLGNPSSISSPEERQRVEQVKDTLMQNSQQGDVLATSILNAANHIVQNAKTSVSETSSMQQVLQQLAQPEIVTSVQDREHLIQIKQDLVTASNGGNQIATSILQTLQQIEQNETNNLQKTITTINHPETSTDSDRERYTQFKETLVFQKEKGNQLATALLALPESPSVEDVRKIQKQIHEAKAGGDQIASDITNFNSSNLPADTLQQMKEQLLDEKQKGNQVAASVLSLLPQDAQQPTVQPASLPETNRIQSVSVEDYEAVRQMWQENYKNIDVPEGTNRKEWITKEGESIDQIITLLSSPDPKQIEAGMQEVSNILPFLMLGGFSQSEIISYLKAKREAGKEIVQELDQEQSNEDTMVNIDQHVTNENTMTQTMAAAIPEVQTPINTVPAAPSYTAPLEMPQAPSEPHQEVASMTGVSMPTLHDLARYDLGHTTSDTGVVSELDKLIRLLRGIANPESFADDQERERVIEIRRALDERKKDDSYAMAILEAADGLNDKGPVAVIPAELLAKLREYINDVLKPGDASEQKKQDDHVRSIVERESQRGNQLARSILLLTKETTIPEIERLKEQLVQESSEANELASAVISALVMQDNAVTLVNTLNALNDPRNAPQAYDKEVLTTLRAQLTRESESGNQFATTLLTATKDTKGETKMQVGQQLIEQGEEGNILAGKVLSQSCKSIEVSALHQKLLQMAQPTANKPAESNAEYKLLHEAAEKKGNALAKAIIAFPVAPSDDQLQVLWKQIATAGKANDTVAKHIIDRIHEIGEAPQAPAPVTLADTNRVQTVNLQDYENVKKLWEENYAKVDLAKGETDRKVWLQKEIAGIEEIAAMIGSTEPAMQRKGMDRVSGLLPFLLLGGFSQQEVISYMQAKLQAAKNVLEKIGTEDTEMTVSAGEKKEKKAAEMAAEVPASKQPSSSKQQDKQP